MRTCPSLANVKMGATHIHDTKLTCADLEAEGSVSLQLRSKGLREAGEGDSKRLIALPEM